MCCVVCTQDMIPNWKACWRKLTDGSSFCLMVQHVPYSSKVSQEVPGLRTCTKNISAFLITLSEIWSPWWAPKYFRYRIESSLIAAALVPNLLVKSQPVSVCMAGKTVHNPSGSFVASVCDGINRVVAPTPARIHSSFRPWFFIKL